LPGGELPAADAIVNPRRSDCPSGASDLCGAGVAFKLVQALAVELGLPENLPLHFLDLVALATVADLVPLVGENRILVRYGLKKLASSRWPGVRALIEVAGLAGKPVRAGHVGFILAPRLNAVGRIADAMDGVRLLLNDDEGSARDQARELEGLNARRRALDQEILDEAVAQIKESTDLENTVGLVLASDDWHAGVIGIVASRVVERYARPTFLVALDGEEGKGSGRSVAGFDLHAALSECAEYLVKYGGHRMAAGLTVKRDRLEAFKSAFNEAARRRLRKEDLVGTQRIDALVSVKQLDRRLERLLRHLEPCGLGNPAPVFAVTGARVRMPREVGNNHLKFMLEDQTGSLSAIGFDLADRVNRDWLGGQVDVAFRFEENEWSGGSTLQARVVNLRPTG
jgi:single-stranded-DNA-specific exonuclease